MGVTEHSDGWGAGGGLRGGETSGLTSQGQADVPRRRCAGRGCAQGHLGRPPRGRPCSAAGRSAAGAAVLAASGAGGCCGGDGRRVGLSVRAVRQTLSPRVTRPRGCVGSHHRPGKPSPRRYGDGGLCGAASSAGGAVDGWRQPGPDRSRRGPSARGPGSVAHGTVGSAGARESVARADARGVRVVRDKQGPVVNVSFGSDPLLSPRWAKGTWRLRSCPRPAAGDGGTEPPLPGLVCWRPGAPLRPLGMQASPWNVGCEAAKPRGSIAGDGAGTQDGVCVTL